MASQRRIFGIGGAVLGLLLLTLVISQCAKQPFQEPKENVPPETIISSWDLTKVPDDPTGTKFLYTVQFYGLDFDGRVKGYSYKLDEEPWSEYTVTFSVTDTVVFQSEEEVHVFYVKCKDDQEAEDPTPATATLSLKAHPANATPETEMEVGPPDGAITTGGLRIYLAGTDLDGYVKAFEYRVDGGAWESVPTDTLGKGVVEFSVDKGNVLADGPHAFEARAVDNLGAVDPTPVTTSFYASSTRGFKPVITITKKPPKVIFVGVGETADAAITFSGDASYYYGEVAAYSFSTDRVNWSPWSSDNDTTLAGLAEGTYSFWVRAKDLAGNVAESEETKFSVKAAEIRSLGILLVNGVHWDTYGSEIVNFYKNKVAFDDFPISFWDVFDPPAGGYPAEIADAALGNGDILEGMLKYFSTVIWIGNNYAGDLPYWERALPQIKEYISVYEGNLLLATRLLHYFFKDDEFKSLCQIKTFAKGAGSWPYIVPSALKALLPELVDIPVHGFSGTVGVSEIADPTLAEPIFENADTPGEYLGLRVRLAPDKPWQIVIICGRPYRLDPDAARQNISYILENWFHESR